jgi:hypothetical protein
MPPDLLVGLEDQDQHQFYNQCYGKIQFYGRQIEHNHIVQPYPESKPGCQGCQKEIDYYFSGKEVFLVYQ